MNRDLLLIFARNPALGKVKTRLAKSIGDENALQIYQHLLKHTVSVTKGLKADKRVCYSENTVENDIWSNEIFQKTVQSGNDLGRRMQHAFQTAFEEGYQKVVIIGTDLLELKQTHIEEAFRKLDSCDCVFGPADDGGYYLMGMSEIKPQLFMHKKWGTNTVLEDSLKDLFGEKVCLLETLNDIDVVEDIIGVEVFKKYLK
jgi:rSAM/selenodomain-associated transferase 1